MTSSDRSVLLRLKALLTERVPLSELILFGSRARGDADPDSDMDVVVLVQGEITKEIRDHVSDCAWEAGFEQGVIVVPVAFSREEWETGPERSSLLAAAVTAEGLKI
jgi:DNA polymerase sigma